MLTEDPSDFGLIYILKFSCNFNYFIGQVSKNTSSNCGNTTSEVLIKLLSVMQYIALGPLWYMSRQFLNCWYFNRKFLMCDYIICHSIDMFKFTCFQSSKQFVFL